MTKDHSPGDFSRESSYKSDLEIAETGPQVKSVNTSFGSRNHNAYIHRSDGTHEHFWYNPQNQKSGWHGHNFETKNNHPQKQDKGDNHMEKNSFIESLKVDKETSQRLNEVSQNAAKHANSQSVSKSGPDNGGRERGDSGPLSEGREAGYKSGPPNSHSNSGEAHSSGGNNNGGHTSGEGHGIGGQSSAGHAAGYGGGH